MYSVVTDVKIVAIASQNNSLKNVITSVMFILCTNFTFQPFIALLDFLCSCLLLLHVYPHFPVSSSVYVKLKAAASLSQTYSIMFQQHLCFQLVKGSTHVLALTAADNAHLLTFHRLFASSQCLSAVEPKAFSVSLTAKCPSMVINRISVFWHLSCRVTYVSIVQAQTSYSLASKQHNRICKNITLEMKA